MTTCRSPGSHSAEGAEPHIAYADLRAETPASEIDWHTTDFERIAEQTLGGGALA